MMHLFYSPHIDGDTLELDEKESKHSVRVLRLRTGDRVHLVDGTGGWYEAVIEDDHPRHCKLRILTRTPDHQPLPYALHLAISPTKSADRFEWFLEKATEIGISEITPLLCRRTERTRFNFDRLEKIIISAMKQALRAYRPVLHQPATLSEFVAIERSGTKGIAHCIPREPTGNREPEILPERAGIADLPRHSSYTLLVGPEGDFTEEEVKTAIDSGYVPFHLGDARLRTETAGVYICAAISLRSASNRYG